MNLITHPRSWWASRNAKKTYRKNLEKGWDVVLPPIQIEKPSVFTIMSDKDNWGNDYLEIDKHIDELKLRFKRKFVVFVLDTAGKYTNPYLTNHAWNHLGVSFTGESGLEDVQGHSTHVAGIVVGDHPTHKLGVARVMAQAGYLKVVPVKVLNDRGSGAYPWIQAGIDYVREVNVPAGWEKVINLSLGGSTSSPGVAASLEAAEKEGILIFGSAGNSGYVEGQDRISFPGRHESVFCTGSIDPNGDRSSFSSVGKAIDFTHPGSGIWSTYGNDLAKLSGTSMSTPMKLATTLMLLSGTEISGYENVYNYLLSRITDVMTEGWDKFTGHGVAKPAPYLKGDDPVEDPPEDPVEEDPIEEEPPVDIVKPKREHLFPLEGPFTTRYMVPTSTGRKFVDAELEIVVEHTSTKLTEISYAEVLDATEQWFSGRGLGFSFYPDITEVAYWSARLYEMFLPKYYNIEVEVRNITIKTKDGIVQLNNPTMKKLSTLSENDVKTFNYDDFI